MLVRVVAVCLLLGACRGDGASSKSALAQGSGAGSSAQGGSDTSNPRAGAPGTAGGSSARAGSPSMTQGGTSSQTTGGVSGTSATQAGQSNQGGTSAGGTGTSAAGASGSASGAGTGGSAAGGATSGEDVKPLGIPGNWQLAFRDEFDGNALNANSWQIFDPALPWTGPGRYDNTADFGNCKWRQANVALSGGILTLTQDNTAGTQYGGGIVSKFPLSYGYYEAKLQFVSGFPAWWLVTHEVGSDPTPQNPAVSGTEMDIAEGLAWSGTPSRIHHAVHWNGYATEHKTESFHSGKADDAGWHTIGLWWTASSYRFYVDGSLTWTFSTAISQSLKEYMVLNNAYWVGGDTSGVARWDYVRYWTGG